MTGKNKLILLILDGWGFRESKDHNAVQLSNPVNFNRLWNNEPHMLLNASEEYVGLPSGQMGNSEVGHMNIGAGRVVYQDFLRINKAVDSGKILENDNISSFFDKIKNCGGTLHFFGLVSDGGVHSHINHLKGLVKAAKDSGIERVCIHAFMDGRDTPPKSGINYIKELNEYLSINNYGKITTVSGRYYAMDRDKRWDRIEKAYNAIVRGKGRIADSPEKAVKYAYEAGESDEFITPTVIEDDFLRMEKGDGIFFFNFRADRARQLTTVFTDKNFNQFKTEPVNPYYMTMTSYDKAFDVPVAFPPLSLENIFGEVLSVNKLAQMRIAETEKYAHVTFFFNGGREVEFKGEIRELIPSPREVATYDEKPEMSVKKVCDRFEERFLSKDIDFTVMNFANPDMVGHTGVEEAAVKACKAVDEQLGRVVKIARDTDSVLVVTADHGNSEQMWDEENNQPHTAHTLNRVPFIIFNYDCKLRSSSDAKLADIAPTLLDILKIKKPKEMTGESLLVK
ncbi:2,3-bisphosphoglycerate-independent phosphoglycerate mutase [Flexistipes sinusarabici]|uniref:2,3-bisphosphoglycerate-independent phosphoglycerate mutase n=1 Tax=Flexistipes sinusarabici TaxID=2352 RepID=UPI0023577DA6|nr:2,3-bisphosphoglycerate-independent phosphoglycerate mutase [Flexistipes sinusarabici]